MNPRINQLVRTLLQKDSLAECSLPELQQFAERHPYFGAAQLLLTKKMQTESAEGYQEQLQKTLLFFHNPGWVDQLLNDTGNATVIKAKKEEEAVETADPVPALVNETAVTAANPPEIATNITQPEPEAETEEIPMPVEVATEPVAETAVRETVTEAETLDQPTTPGPAPALSAVELAEAGAATTGTAPTETTEVPDTIAKNDLPGDASSLPSPVKAPKEELLFEPFHTVDYFASQGIRIREEEKPADKFGQQLRSFTEWLKTLKKVPVSEIAKTAEPASEKKVVEMAESSIVDREVVTEAMAEVWEKQGNAAKAIAIYSKLSLLEPAKSTYFAAKIEDLKKQS